LKQTSLFIIASLLLIIQSCTQKATPERLYTLAEAKELYRKSAFMNDSMPQKAVNGYLSSAKAFLQNGDAKSAGMAFGNAAVALIEKLNKRDSALIIMKECIKNYKIAYDSAKIALSYEIAAKIATSKEKLTVSDMDEALKMHDDPKYQNGLSIVKMKYVDVLCDAKDYKKADQMFNEATAYFKQRYQLANLFNANIIGLRLYREMNNRTRWDEVRNENEALASNKNPNPDILKRFEDALLKYTF
jgi:tetratricopeptide (TPR) repeat protein